MIILISVGTVILGIPYSDTRRRKNDCCGDCEDDRSVHDMDSVRDVITFESGKEGYLYNDIRWS